MTPAAKGHSVEKKVGRRKKELGRGRKTREEKKKKKKRNNIIVFPLFFFSFPLLADRLKLRGLKEEGGKPGGRKGKREKRRAGPAPSSSRFHPYSIER